MSDYDTEHQVRAALTYLAEPADSRLIALIRACGAVRALTSIQNGRLPHRVSAAVFGDTAAGRTAANRAMTRWRSRLSYLPAPGDLDRHATAGIRLICPGDPDWPPQVADLGDAEPIALWLRGTASLRTLAQRSIVVTGSRAATAYGAYLAAGIAASLTERGWTVTSGAAYGIDTAAHRGALSAGATIAVLASGIDHPYPYGNRSLLDTIAANGLVISEYPPGQSATRLRFSARNRIFAALATATVVVEAACRSGSLTAARHATTLGRPVMAVPGPVTSGQSAGTNTLIRDGQASLVTSADDIIATVTHRTAKTGLAA